MGKTLSFGEPAEWPDLDAMSEEELHRELSEVWERIAVLDYQEPEDMNSEEYETWAEAHEDLEDLADEIQDRLE